MSGLRLCWDIFVGLHLYVRVWNVWIKVMLRYFQLALPSCKSLKCLDWGYAEIFPVGQYLPVPSRKSLKCLNWGYTEIFSVGLLLHVIVWTVWTFTAICQNVSFWLRCGCWDLAVHTQPTCLREAFLIDCLSASQCCLSRPGFRSDQDADD